MLVLSRQREDVLIVTVNDPTLAAIAAAALTGDMDKIKALLISHVPPRVEITVVDIRGDKVRIGTEAFVGESAVGKEVVTVDRKEVHEAKLKEAADAANKPPA